MRLFGIVAVVALIVIFPVSIIGQGDSAQTQAGLSGIHMLFVDDAHLNAPELQSIGISSGQITTQIKVRLRSAGIVLGTTVKDMPLSENWAELIFTIDSMKDSNSRYFTYSV